MAAMSIIGREGESKPRKISNSIFRRKVTDKFGLITFIFLMVYWMGLYGYAIHLVRNPAHSFRDKFKHSETTNISSGSEGHLNVSTSAIKQLASLMNSTTDILNSIELFSGTCIYHVVRISSLLMLIFVFTQYSLAVSEILSKAFDLEYNNHVFIIISSRIIITLTVILGISIIYFECLLEFKTMLSLLFSLELLMVFPTIAFFASYDYDNLKETLRYYTRYRYLFIFKFLNVIFMTLLITCNVIIWKNLGKQNLGYATLISIGNLVIVSMICKYEKIVIIAVTACHECDDQKKTVSLKTILSTLVTIGKYHLGTMFISILPMSEYLLRDLRWSNFEIYEGLVQHFNKPYLVSHIIEHSTMIVAIRGQNFNDAVNDAISLEAVGCLKCCAKSKAVIAWKNTLRVYSTGTALIISIYLMEALSVEALSLIIVAVAHYTASRGLYYCIFSVINTIEHTIEFSKVEKKRNEIAHNMHLFGEINLHTAV